MIRLEGEVAFITGAASGIGLALAHALARQGMHIAMADVDENALQDAATHIGASGARVVPLVMDVQDVGAWQRAIDHVESQLGPIALLCNNAGVGLGAAPCEQIEPGDWNWLLGINLGGVFLGVRAVVGRMKARGRGHIVNTSSILGLFPKAYHAPYIAAKFAVVGFSEALRAELMPHGVGVTIFMPGLVRTAQSANARASKQMAPSNASHIIAKPEGIQPDAVSDVIIAAILENRFYAITHSEYLPVVEHRMNRLIKALQSAPATGEDILFLAHDSLNLS